MSAATEPGEFHGLRDYLLAQSERCLRPAVDRFRHPWLAPMPLSDVAARYLAHRAAASGGSAEERLAHASTGDGFAFGDYSLGLFHHDVSEASIELLRHLAFRDGAAGSLACLLDTASPNGAVHRAELCNKSREVDPAKPVIAQYALRVLRALGPAATEWFDRNRILDRVLRFLKFTEEHYAGLHGLFLTHSALQSGFDSDVLTADLPHRAVEGPDTNAFMVLEYQAAAALCRELGYPGVSSEFEEKAARLSELVEKLTWFEDEGGGFYLGLRWQHGVGSLEGEVVGLRDPDGVYRPLESWTCLLPLYAGIPSPARARSLVRRLLDPARYWGPHGVRTLPSDSVFFNQAPRMLLHDENKSGRGPVSNWSGPVWILSNYYLASGLARYGFAAEARELALKTARLLAADLQATGCLHECYDDSGRGLWPRRGTFLSWNVLALTLLREHVPGSVV